MTPATSPARPGRDGGEVAARTAGASISVVICAYSLERWDDLCTAVYSAMLQVLPPARIIVVVDHNAELLELARAQFPTVLVVENAEGPGLSGARNSGIAASTGDIVAFLDDDAVADARWLERLAYAYEDERVLAVGGHIEPLWDAGRPHWCPEEFDWVFGCSYKGMPEEPASVRNVIGANMSFRRSVLLEVDNFRAGLGRTSERPMGAEETDACIRVRQRRPDGVILYEPRAGVHHRVPATRANWSYFRARCFAEGLSKARLARSVGSRDGLSSERRHVLETLPRGVVHRLGDTLAGRDAWGVAQAAAIIAGLAVTATGYVVGRWGETADAERPPIA